MNKKNQIFKKYLNLIVTTTKYCHSRWSDIIEPKDMFVSLSDLFYKNEDINNFFLEFDLDLEKIIEQLNNEYDIESFDLYEIKWTNFGLSNETLEVLQNLEDIRTTELFSLNLFLELLFKVNVWKDFKDILDLEKLVDMNPKDFLDKAYNNKNLKKQFVSIFDLENSFSKEIEKTKINIKDSEDEYWDFDYEEESFEEESLEEEWGAVEKKTATESNKNKKKLAIDTFWLNLVSEAQKWNLEPVLWREKEMGEVIFTLLRKTKSNPLLIWESWVGKTAIVEWLAQKIANWDVPAKLKNKKIYNLDMWTLIAWTKFRGEFEARLKNIIQECVNPENNIILFVDETHTIVWAWNQEWWVDTANIIKPHLARWELTLIGATTFNEYKKHIEKDPALTRRFQTVKIEEPSWEDSVQLISWIKYRFENFHGVNIGKDAIEKAVNLSKRFILDKHLPDKAIDLVDEACSRKSSKSISKEKSIEIDELNKKIDKIEKKMAKAVEKQDYFTAADYKEDILNLKNEIYAIQSSDDTPEYLREVVAWEDIEKVIAEKYWISSSVLSKSEVEFLKELKNNLNKKILWQQKTVEKVVNSIIRNKFSPMNKEKPIWSFLFLGPSWVWKTYLSNLLASYYFQDEKALIKINMSEYSQDMSANQLTWASAWYVWYEEWGILTESVRKKPYSVVLFDEIEKWSSQVLNILLQILDNGYLEDNRWRKIDFKNTIIILTSNIWLEYFTKEVTKVGFDSSKETKQEDISDEKKEMIMNEVKNILPVELINRFDDIVYFNQIDKNLLREIFNKYYKEYRDLWKNKRWITPPRLNRTTVDKVIEDVYESWSWVRWIEKYLYNEFENKVIKKILW